jgi:hypothetical protein
MFSIVPVGSFDGFKSSSFFGVCFCHGDEEIFKVIVKKAGLFILDFAVLFEKPFGVIAEKLRELNASDSFGFELRENALSFEGKEDDSSRKNVGSSSVVASSLHDFRSSVIFGAVANDDGIISEMSHIKICDFQVEIVSDEEIIEFDVHMGNSVVMKVFKALDQLSKESSSELFIHVLALLLEEVEEISILGIFHNGVGYFHIIFIKAGFSLIFEIEVSHYMRVLEASKS